MSICAVDSAAYQSALDFLFGRLNYERMSQMPYHKTALNLERMRELLRCLGNPDAGQRIVHIAGTKGKGSTAQLVSSVLMAHGHSVGLYTSPHLHRVEERFVVNGQCCSTQDFVELIDIVRPIVDEFDTDANRAFGKGATFFELTTALAFLHFARRKTDFIVLEVGLGGRLDSTNVCHPAVSAITSISMDHMAQLGDTLDAIAREKAGIIKPNVPVVSGVVVDPARREIERIADERQSPTLTLGVDYDFQYYPTEVLDASHCRPAFDYLRLRGGQVASRFDRLELNMLGRHQAANAAIAVTIVELLSQHGVTLDEAKLRTGLLAARSDARIEIIQWKPTVIVDTAHNEASIEALVEVVNQSFPRRRRHLLFGTTEGKAVGPMIAQLVSEFDLIVCTRYWNNPRSVDPEELAQRCRQIANESTRDVEIVVAPRPEQAWKEIAACAQADDLICITGSFFLAAEMKALLVPTASPNAIELAGG